MKYFIKNTEITNTSKDINLFTDICWLELSLNDKNHLLNRDNYIRFFVNKMKKYTVLYVNIKPIDLMHPQEYEYILPRIQRMNDNTIFGKVISQEYSKYFTIIP